MLGEAVVWRPSKPTPTGDQVLADPRYALYLAGWPRRGDYGLVAERTDRWAQPGTAHSPKRTMAMASSPRMSRESIAVLASRRWEGIGRRLLTDLIDANVAQGYSALSLAVDAENPARDLYESAGFVLIEKDGTSFSMVRHTGQSD